MVGGSLRQQFGSTALEDKASKRRRGDVAGAARVHVPYRDAKLTRLLQDALGGNAYAAIRPAAGGYVIPSPGKISYFDDPMKADRKVISVEEKRGHYLELNDMWAPVVIQMGRAKDFESFEAFQTSVKENPFTYADGKLSYTSEAGDTYEA